MNTIQEIIRAVLVLILFLTVASLASCSIQRVTPKSIWDVKIQTPVKVHKYNKCD
jgi:hypothetical protein